MAKDRGRPPATAELAVLALVATASLPLTRLFEDGLGPVALLAVVLSIAVTAGLRRLPFGAVGSWAVSTLAMFWFISARFFTDTLWGPFPSWATLSALGEAIRQGADQTIREVAPVEPTVPLLMFVTAGIWATVWLVDTALARLHNPVLAVASAVPLFVVPGAVLTSQRLGTELVLFLAAAGLTLVHDQAERFARLGPSGAQERSPWRLGAALRILVVALAIVAVMAPALPGFGRPPALAGLGGPGARVFFNPIVAIKPALDDNRDIELFRVRASSASYYRLTALDVFDGEAWRPERERQTRRFLSGQIDDAGRSTGPVRQEFEIGALAGPWLPAVYRPVTVYGDNPLVETATDTLLVSDRLQIGLEYTVDSREPSPSIEQLDQPIDYDERALGRLLALPDSLPPRVREIAREITKDATNPYQSALAIQRHLRRFTYDENVAAGHSFEDIVEFLDEVKAGYCEQFAGSMAVLSRALGIPARVAIGFGLGEQVDRGVYKVTTRHAHAWVEVWFPQAGWVAFEPTPRAGVTSLPPYAPPAQADPPPQTAEPTASPRESIPEPEPSELPRSPQDEPGAVGRSMRGWVTALVLLVLGLLVVASGPVIAKVRHRRRLTSAQDARALVGAHYVDFLDWCAAAGLGRSRAETPREHADRIGAPESRSDLATLVELVDEALYGPPNGLVPEEAARAAIAVRKILKPQLKRQSRAKAALRWGSPWRSRLG